MVPGAPILRLVTPLTQIPRTPREERVIPGIAYVDDEGALAPEEGLQAGGASRMRCGALAQLDAAARARAPPARMGR